jgi:hypothetical protein
MNVYIVKYRPNLEPNYLCPEVYEPIIYGIFDSEEKAKKVVKEFPFTFMFYDEHPVK